MRRVGHLMLLLGAIALTVGVAAATAAGPVVTYTVSAGTSGDNSWYRSDVTAQIQYQNATDSTCPLVKTFRSSSDVLDCTATDGTSTISFHLQFKIDKDSPTVTGAQPNRGANANGWFNAPVNVGFAGTDPTSGIASCSQVDYTGPDSGSANVSGTCRDVAGNVSAPSSLAIKYDATAPTVTAAPVRKPDGNGWYNHALAIGYTGSDPTSGVDSCTAATYKGPDTAEGSVPGTCTDKAGNTGTGTFAIKYDSSAPKLAGLVVTPGNGSAVLRWKASPDTAAVTVMRAAAKKGAKAKVVYRGKGSSVNDRKLQNGVRYRYIVKGVDRAGNVATASTVAVPLALSSPAQGARVHAPPLLKWSAVAHASYYNVQLFRGAQKVLSIWPAGTSLKLSRSWSYEGRDFTLVPGRYRWYVWPGVGARPEARYLKLLGGSFFVVAR